MGRQTVFTEADLPEFNARLESLETVHQQTEGAKALVWRDKTQPLTNANPGHGDNTSEQVTARQQMRKFSELLKSHDSLSKSHDSTVRNLSKQLEEHLRQSRGEVAL